MYKINKYLLLIVGVLFTIFSGIQNVSASTASHEPTGYWYERSDNGANYYSWRLDDYYVDGTVAYCIEPGAIAGTDQYREASWDITGFSNSLKEKITLISYYGYRYENHQTMNYRAAAQALIWEEILGGNTQVSFNTKRYGEGTPIDVSYEKEIIRNLVNHHYDKPSFNGTSYEAQVGEPIIITDTNNVLSNYDVFATNDAEVIVDSNTITIIPTKVGEITIRLTKKMVYDKSYIVYYADGYQNMITTGNVDPVNASINITGLGGKVEIQKVDSNTLTSTPLGEATLEGAIYGVYDEDDNLIQTLTTDANGYAISEYLPSLGRYYVKEIEASKGYQLSDEKYYFNSSKDEMLSYVKVLEDVITRKYEFTKVIASDKTGIMTPEVNVEFGIYNNKNELYQKVVTDEYGKIYLNLPYGSYTLKQLTSIKDHEKIEDYNFEIKELGETVNKVFANADITARLKVIKIDSETGQVIKRANIKFKIYNVDKNEYVCQTITYPRAQTICEYETDDDGILITPYPLKSGTYYLEEVDQIIDGYTWNKESIEFHIGDDSKCTSDSEFGILFEVKFSNKQVKGSIEITKLGEELIVENNSYHYEEIKLSNVTYELYALNDIISGDGNKIFNKDDLIGTYTTDDNGYLKISDLYLGSYYLVEVSTLDNHVLDDTKHDFVLKYEDQYTPIVSLDFVFKNYMKKGTLEFSKTDVSTSEPLPNTKIQIFDEESDALIFEGVTDENGKIVITDLYIGKFYLIESEAPDGYQLNPKEMHFEITTNGEIVKAEMTDEVIVKVPKTALTDFKVLDIIGILFIIIGASYIIYDKDKKIK